MEPIEIAKRLKERFPEEVIETTQFLDQVSVVVKKDKIVDLCRYLHDEPDLYFDYLVDLCGVDHFGKRPRFEIVYNLYSIRHRHRIRLKAGVTEEDLNMESVIPVWAGANWHEREAYDMFGIQFKGHPDLRRILLPEDWEGYPLRKDYPIRGPEKEYSGYEELKDMHKHDDEWIIKA